MSAGPARKRAAVEDTGLEAIEALVADIRASPARYPEAAAAAEYGRLAPAKLALLTRRHYHATPEDLLRRARFAVARQALLSGRTAAAASHLAGYIDASEMAADFMAFAGLSPSAYGKLRQGADFTLELPPDYPLPYLRRALGRDRYSATERLAENIYTAGTRAGGEPHLIELELAPDKIRVKAGRTTPHLAEIHHIVTGLAGLGQDTAAFVSQVQQLGLERLIEGRPGMRIAQTHTIFDGLLWAIIGQQINLAFACQLRRRLIELAGTRLGNSNLYAPPGPAAVAALEPADLLPLKFSRPKADYTISISRLVAEGKLDLDGLRLMSATRVERTLLAIRGLGPWSVNYIMMRSLGFADCLPLGDTGVNSSLRQLFNLADRPGKAEILRHMAPFSPYRSLTTAHLWQLGQQPP